MDLFGIAQFFNSISMNLLIKTTPLITSAFKVFVALFLEQF